MVSTWINPHRILQGRHLLKSLRPHQKLALSLHRSTTCDSYVHKELSRRNLSSVFNSGNSVASCISVVPSGFGLNADKVNINSCGCQLIRCFSSASRIHHASTDADQNTYDQSEVDKFSRLSNYWWNEQGEFGALHSLNTLRVPLIRDALMETATSGQPQTHPLRGFRIVDVGCGGGILCEPLARLGAEVLGMDASAENVAAAEAHAAHDPRLAGHLSYRTGLIEDLAAEVGPVYNGVVASEVLEHVADVKFFVQACCDLLKPGGSVFFTTLNRTQVAYVLAVVAAERVLKIVPAGAHDWNKFITPEELSVMLQQSGAEVKLVHGMRLNPFSLQWCWSSDVNINYAVHAIKL